MPHRRNSVVRKTPVVTLIWSYLSEFVLASVVSLVAWRLIPSSHLKVMVFDASAIWVAVLSACVGLAVGALIAFYAMTQNNFGVWLRHRNSFGVYALAFSFPLVMFLLGIVVVLALHSYGVAAVALGVTTTILAYSAVLLITLLKNMYEFAVLALKFREVKNSKTIDSVKK